MFDYLAVPAYALVTALAGLLHTPIAVTIVLTTVLIRLMLLPLGIAQHRAQRRAEKRRAGLSERASQIEKRFRGNPQRLQKEIAAFYRAEAPGLATNTVRGCLPVLAQMPVFSALYLAFSAPTLAGKANILLQESLLGVPLGAHLISSTGPQLALFATVLILLGAIAFVSTRLARPRPIGWVRLVHYVPMLSVAFLPLAASLYLVTSMTWTVAQTAILRQWLG